MNMRKALTIVLTAGVVLALSGAVEANLITDGSFEVNTNGTAGNSQGSELGGSTYAGSTWGNADVTTYWDKSGSRTWYMTDGGANTFPDGDFAFRVDSAGNEGVNTLYQDGISLTAGTLYELSFEMWGETSSPRIDVDLTGPANINLFDNEYTNGSDNATELKSVQFTATATGPYRISFSADDPANGNHHAWIDDVILLELLELELTSIASDFWDLAGTWAPTAVPTDEDDVLIDGETVTARAGYTNEAEDVTVSDGWLVVGSGATLTVGGDLTIEDPGDLSILGTLNTGAITSDTDTIIGAGGLLNTGTGALSGVSNSSGGIATIQNSGAVTATGLNLSGGSTFTKSGAGTLSFTTGNNSISSGSTVNVADGVLSMQPASNPMGQGDLILSGGTFHVSGSFLPAANLVAHWDLDDAVGTNPIVDSVSGYNAYQTGAPVLGIAGKAGTAGSFPSGNNYFRTAGQAGLNLPEFTFSTWFNPMNSGGGGHNVVIANRDGENGFIVYQLNDVIEFWLRATGGGWQSQSVPIVRGVDQWYHIAGSYDPAGGIKKFYVTPESEASATADATMSEATLLLHGGGPRFGIGVRGDGDLPLRGGYIDDVLFYSEALSDADVDYLFQHPGGLTDMTDTDVTVTGTGSGILADAPVDFGSLGLGAGSDLSLSGQRITFTGTTLADASTLTVGSGGGDLGVTTSGSATVETIGNATATQLVLNANDTFTKTGGGKLSFTTGNNTIPSGSAVNVAEGELFMQAASNPMGSGGLTLSGGTFHVGGVGSTMPAGADGYYSFDNTSGSTVYNDGSVAGKDGTLTGGAALTTGGGGMIGEGMTIADNSGQYLQLPSPVDIGAEWTIATWFYNLHPANAWRTLSRASGGGHQVIGYQNNNSLGVYEGGFRDSGYDLAPGAGWHHITAIGSGGTTDLYIDGVYVGASDRQSQADVYAIGNYQGGGQPFAQRIDEFFVYNRALDLTEIQALYDAGLAGSYPLDMTATNVTVSASTTGSGIQADSPVNFGSLGLGAASDVTTSGQKITFTGISADNGATIINNNPVESPTLALTTGATFTKGGSGQLSFTSGPNTIDGTNTVQVDDGVLFMQAASDPLGGADLVLDGGTFQVSADSDPIFGAKYVQVVQNYSETFQVAEVQAFEAGTGTNVALQSQGGVATAISWAHGSIPGDANDGNTRGEWGAGSVWHSSGGMGSWLTITLNAPTDLDAVRLWGRTDCCQNRQNDFYLIIKDAANNELYNERITGAGTSPGRNRLIDVTTPLPTNMTNTNVTVSAAGSGIAVDRAAASFGALTVNAGANLTTSGEKVNFTSTTMKDGSALTVGSGGANLATVGEVKTDGTVTIGGSTSKTTIPTLNVNSGHLTINNLPTGLAMPDGIQLWLDASDIDADGSPDSIANGALITTWSDKSGQGHNATDSGGDPNYVASGPNGAPVVNFDGNDFLATTYDFRPEDYTILTVARYTGGDSKRVISSRDGRNWLFGFHDNRDERWYADGWIHTTGNGNTAWHIHAGTMDGPGDPMADFWKDGVLLIDDGRGSRNDSYYWPQRIQLGGWKGGSEMSRSEVAEVLFFDRVLTADELNDIGGYLNSKYGLGFGGYTGSLGPVAFGDLTMAAGSQLSLNSDGSGAASFASITAGHNATIHGRVTAAGSVTPGSSTGTLNIDGDLTMATDAVYNWEMGPSVLDLVAISGNFEFEGSWDLNIINAGGNPDLSDTFTLFEYGTLSGFNSGLVDITGPANWDVTTAQVLDDGSGKRIYLTGVEITTLISQATGNWIDGPTTWKFRDGSPGVTPIAGYKTIVEDNHKVTVATADGAAYALEINGASAEVEISPSRTLTIGTEVDVIQGLLDIQGTLNADEVSVESAGTVDVAGTLNANSVGVTGGSLTITGTLDTATITSDTVTAIGGGGELITGTGSLAGMAITGNATINNSGAVTAGAIIGGGGLIKAGAGTLTLTGNNTYTGGTTVNDGTLRLDLAARSGAVNLGAVSVASSGTLELYNTNAAVDNVLITGTSNIIGAGTVTKTGPGYIGLWNDSDTIKDFAGLVDVQGGTLGSNGNGWQSSAGLMDLNIAGGASFDIRTQNVVINKLTGSGTVGSSHNTAVTLSVGNNDGNSTFDGIIRNGGTFPGGLNTGVISLTKAGTGTLTLGGSNTYSGATTIAGGTLQLQAPATTAPGSIAGLLVHLDANNVTGGGNPADGTQIGTWTNLASGGAGNFTGGTSPYVNWTGNPMNGNSVVHFWGGLLSNSTNFGNNVTVMYVGRMDGGSNRRLLDASGNNWLLGYWGGNMNTVYWNNGGQLSGALDYNSHIFMATADGSTGRAYNIDGTEVLFNTRGLGGASQGPNGMRLGGSTGERSYGDVGEVLVFNRALTAAERLQMEQYLQAKWYGVLPSKTAVNLTASGATLDLNGVNQTIGSLAGVDGSQVLLNGGWLTTGQNNASTTFSGAIGDGSTAGGGLAKVGTGTLTLAGTSANTFTGPTVISRGRMALSKAAGVTAIPGDILMLNSLSPTMWMTADNQLGGNGVLSFADEVNADIGNARFNLIGTTQSLAGIVAEIGYRNGVIQNSESAYGGPHNTGTSTLVLTGSDDYSFNGYLRNANGTLQLTKTGSGTQSLVGDRINYTGATNVTGGTLRLTNATGFNSSTQIGPGATLDVNLTTTWNVPTMTFSGTGTLLKSGAGTMIAGQNGNTYISMGAGGLIDIQQGVLRNNNHSGRWSANQASMNIESAGQLWLYADNVYVDALTGTGAVYANYSDNDDILFVGVAGGTGTFSGTMANGGSGALNVTKQGAGTQTLSGSNISYTGATNVNGGVLELTDNGSGSGDAFRSNVTNNATLWLTSTGPTSDFRANISGPGTIIKKGPGMVRLGPWGGVAQVTGSGDITIEQGILQSAGRSNYRMFDTTGDLIINGGARFDYSALNDASAGTASRFGALIGSGNITVGWGTHYIQFGNGDKSGVFSGSISGAINVTKIGTGTQTFSGVSTYGGTTVNDGTLELSRPGNSAVGTIRGTLTVNPGATVRTTTNNSLGWGGGTRVTTLNLNGGLLDNTATGDQGWGIAINMTGGTLQSNGGVGSPVAGSYFSLGGGSSINSLASNTTSVISGRVNIREGNPGNVLAFNVADGAAAVDLLVSASVTEQGGSRGIRKTGAGALTLSGISSNTYSGTTIIDNGTTYLGKTGGAYAISGPVQMGGGNGNQPNLRMLEDNQFAPGVVMSFANNWGSWARFDLQGTTQTLAGLDTGGLAKGAVVQNERFGGGGTSADGTLTLDVASGDAYSYYGYLRDEDDGGHTYKLNLVKDGAGTQTLVGPQITYTGTTTVNDGKLIFANTTALGAGTIDNDATVAFFVDGGNTAVIPGTLSGSGVYEVDGPGGGNEFQNRVILRGDSADNTGTINVINGGKLWLDRGVNAIGDSSIVNVGSGGSFSIFSAAGSDGYGTFQVAETIGGLSGSGNVYSYWQSGGIAPELTVGGGDASATFSGTISEWPGTTAGLKLVKTGTGTQTLSGANTFTGGTTVNDGTLELSRPGNSAVGTIRGTLTVNPGATVRTTTNNSLGWGGGTRVTTLNLNGGLLDNTATGDQGWGIAINMTGGTLQSNGGVSSPGAGSYFSLGDGSSINSLASNTTSVISGRVNIREGNPGGVLPFDVADGAAAVDLLVSAAVTQQNGAWGITKDGDGTLTLTAANTYTGATTINAGTLLVDGSITSNTTVQSDGTLGGTGTIFGSVDIQGGAISPGASPGTLNIVGNFTMGTDSTYYWEGNSSVQDQVAVNGNLDVSANWNLHLSLDEYLAPGTSYDLFTYTGVLTGGGSPMTNVTVTGSVSGMTATPYDDMILVSSTVSSDSNSVFVTLPTPVFWNSTGTPYNVAARWDDAYGNTSTTAPNAGIAAIVNTNGTVSTVTAAMGTQYAHTLIIDGGDVHVDGGNLQVVHNTHVLADSSLTVNSTFGATKLDVAGGTVDVGDDGDVTVDELVVSAGSVDTGSVANITIQDKMLLGATGSATEYVIDSAPSFQAGGEIDNAAADRLILSGGTLTISPPGVGGPLEDARVVRIIQNKPTGPNPLQLGEVEAIEYSTLTNVALSGNGGVATQSSQLGGFGPWLANDGNYGNFQHTNDGQGQWWQVEFAADTDLEKVTIFSRVGCCSQGRTADIQLQVFADAALTNMIYDEQVLGIGTSDMRDIVLSVPMVPTLDLSDTDIFVETDSTLKPMALEASFGDLTIDPGAGLTLSTARSSFASTGMGNLSSLTVGSPGADTGSLITIGSTTIDNSGQVTVGGASIGTGRLSVSVSGGATDFTNTVNLANNATLSFGSGGGSLVDVSVASSNTGTIETAVDVDASHLTLTGTATFVKDGIAKLSFLQSAGTNSLAAGTTVRVDEGELFMQALSNPMDEGNLVLNGGTFTVQGLTVGIRTAPTGAIAQWQFENAGDLGYDSAKPSRSRSYVGTPSQNADGMVGAALELDGDNDLINVGSDADFDINTFTVSAWLKADTLSGWRTAFGQWNSGWIHFGLHDNDRWSDHGGVETRDNTETVTPGKWYHVTSVRDPDNDTFQLWVGDENNAPTLRSEVISGGTPGIPGGNNVYIGTPYNGYTNDWDGLIDELFLYDRPLDGSDIQALYDAGRRPIPGAIDMHETPVSVTDTSTLNAITDFTAQFGALSFDATTGSVSLTITGAQGGLSFTEATINVGGTVGLNTEVDTAIVGDLDGTNKTVTILKTGSGDLLVDGEGSGLDDATFDVQEGTLLGLHHSAGPFGNAEIVLDGGDLVLSSAGGNVTYNNAVRVEADASLTAGAAGIGAAGPLDLTLTNAGTGIALNAGTLTARTTDDYRLIVPGTISGDGSIAITGSSVKAEQGIQAEAISVSDTTLETGGDVTAEAALNLSGGRLISSGMDVLVTGDTVQITNTPDVDITQVGAHLTINVPEGAVGIGGGIPAGLEAHFDASVGITESGGVVQSWTDQSASGNNASLGSGAPALAANELNGLPVVQFRGNDDWLDLTSQFQARQIYTVFRSPNATFSTYGSVFGSVTEGMGRTFIFQTGQTYMHSNPYPIALKKDGTSLSGNFNLAPIDEYMLLTVNTAYPDNLRSYRIGSQEGWAAEIDVAEVLVFDRTLTTEEENNLGGYLAGKYGLTTSYTGSINSGFGDLVMADASRLTLGGAGEASFVSIAPGRNSIIDGDISVYDSVLRGTGAGPLSINGSLAMPNDGTLYEWEVGDGAQDQINVSGDLSIASTWTLALYDDGAGANVGDMVSGNVVLFDYEGAASVGDSTIDNTAVAALPNWFTDYLWIEHDEDAKQVILKGLMVTGGPDGELIWDGELGGNEAKWGYVSAGKKGNKNKPAEPGLSHWSTEGTPETRVEEIPTLVDTIGQAAFVPHGDMTVESLNQGEIHGAYSLDVSGTGAVTIDNNATLRILTATNVDSTGTLAINGILDTTYITSAAPVTTIGSSGKLKVRLGGSVQTLAGSGTPEVEVVEGNVDATDLNLAANTIFTKIGEGKFSVTSGINTIPDSSAVQVDGGELFMQAVTGVNPMDEGDLRLGGGTFSVAGPTGSYVIVAPSGAQAYWSFDNSGDPGADDSGGGHPAGTLNSPTWVAGGQSGGALEFDGNDYANAVLNVSESAYASSMWFKADGDNRGLYSVHDGNPTGGSADRLIWLTGDNLGARTWNNEIITTSALDVADAQWHHVVHTFGGTEGGQKLYVDGVLAASGSKANSDFTAQTSVTIGFANDGTNDWFDGLIDEVRIYDRAMTAADVTALYGAGQTVYFNDAIDMSDTNVFVKPNTTGSGIDAITDYDLTLGNLVINSRGDLTLTGGKVNFASTTLANRSKLTAAGNGAYLANTQISGYVTIVNSGTGEIEADTVTASSTIDLTGTMTADNLVLPADGSFTKEGPGKLSFTTGDNTIDETNIIKVNAGELYMTYNGSNPIGDPSAGLHLGGGTFSIEAAPIITTAADVAVGAWTFDDDTADDLSPNANDGTAGGLLTFETDTPLSSGKSLLSHTGGGSGNVLTVPTSTSLESIDDSLSIAYWMKSNLGDNGTWVRIFEHGTEAGGDRSWLICRDGSTNQVDMRVDTVGAGGQHNQNIGRGAPALFDSTWHHVAFTVDSGTWHKYVDGAQVGTGSYNDGDGLANTRPLYIFGRNATGEYVGFLDDVYVFDTALSADQVASLMNTGEFVSFPAMDMSATDVNVRPGTTGSVLNPISDLDTTFGQVQVHKDADLTLTGGHLTFASTHLHAGSRLTVGTSGADLAVLKSHTATVETIGDATASRLEVTGNSTMTKTGAAQLSITGGVNSLSATSTVKVDEGEVVMQALGVTNPMDEGSVHLAGGTFTVLAGTEVGVAPIGALAYYSFDDSGNLGEDSAGTHHGTPAAGATFNSNARFGAGAVEVDGGTDGYINIGNTDFGTMTNDFTIAAHINPDATSGVRRIFGTRPGGASGIGFGTAGDDLRFTTFGVTDYSSGNLAIPTGAWSHIAVSFDSSNQATFYVDGIQVGSMPTGGAAGTSTSDFLIGLATTGQERFDGLIDELYVYNSALDADEVAQLSRLPMPVAVYMAATNVSVTADSTLNAVTQLTAEFGVLRFDAPGIITTTGAAGGITFARTKVNTEGTVGFDTQVDTTAGSVNGGFKEATIVKTGDADLILAGESQKLEGSVFDVQEGRLIASRLAGAEPTAAVPPAPRTINTPNGWAYGWWGWESDYPPGEGWDAENDVTPSPNPLGQAGVQLSGGELALTTSAGGTTAQAPATFNNAIQVTEDSSLTAGQHANGQGGPQFVELGSAVKGVTIQTGKTLSIGTTDVYSLRIAGSVQGGNVEITQGTVALSAGGNLDNLTIPNTSDGQLTVENEVVNIREAGILTLGSSTFEATVGHFEIIDKLTKTSADNIILTGGTVTVSSTAVGPPAGAIAHWGLDETSGTTAADSAGTHTGIVSGNPVWLPAGGKVGGAIDLDGSGDKITAYGINIADSDFSVGFWVNRDDLGEGYVIGHSDQGNNRRLHIGFRDANTFTFAFWANDLNVDNNAWNQTDDWVHFVCTYNAATNLQSIYLNGNTTPIATRTASADFSGTQDLWIGARRSTDNYFGGLVDEVAFYDRVLTPSEVAELHDANVGPGVVSAINMPDVHFSLIDGTESILNLGDATTAAFGDILMTEQVGRGGRPRAWITIAGDFYYTAANPLALEWEKLWYVSRVSWSPGYWVKLEVVPEPGTLLLLGLGGLGMLLKRRRRRA